MTQDGSVRRALLLLGATVFLAACMVVQTNTGWNVNSRIDLVYAVVDHGTFSIDRYHTTAPFATGDKAVYDGHYYSDKVIGVSLVAVPVYAVVHVVANVFGAHPSFQFVQYLLTRLVVSLAAALAAMLLANLLIVLGAIPRLAILATAGAFFGSMLFGYSTVFYPYLPGIACCLGALTLLRAGPLTTRRAAVVGLLLGSALVFDMTFVITVAVVGVFLVAALVRMPRSDALRGAAAATAAGAVPVAVFVAYSTAIFGSPTIPYRYEASDFFRAGMSRGVMGVTSPKLHAMWFLSFDAYRGILFWSPWLLMLVVGAVWLLRTDASMRPVMIAALTTLIGYFLFNAGYYQWWGGAAMGPRLMLPMFAVVPLALVAVCRPDTPRALRVGMWITMAVGVALSLPVSMTNAQTTQSNTTAALLAAKPGDRLHVLQLTIVHDFYSLRWRNIKHDWFFTSTESFALCLLVVGVGVTLAYRAAAHAGDQPGAYIDSTIAATGPGSMVAGS